MSLIFKAAGVWLVLLGSLIGENRTDIFGFKGRSQNVINRAIFKSKEVYLKHSLRHVYSPARGPRTLDRRKFFKNQPIVSSSHSELSREEILAVVGF